MGFAEKFSNRATRVTAAALMPFMIGGVKAEESGFQAKISAINPSAPSIDPEKIKTVDDAEKALRATCSDSDLVDTIIEFLECTTSSTNFDYAKAKEIEPKLLQQTFAYVYTELSENPMASSEWYQVFPIYLKSLNLAAQTTYAIGNDPNTPQGLATQAKDLNASLNGWTAPLVQNFKTFETIRSTAAQSLTATTQLRADSGASR